MHHMKCFWKMQVFKPILLKPPNKSMNLILAQYGLFKMIAFVYEFLGSVTTLT